MKIRKVGFVRVSILLALLFAFSISPGYADTRVWTGSTSGDWGTPGNWDTGVPLAGDDVIIANAGADPVLSADTPDLGSLTITNKTLLFTNWTTTLKATNVFIRDAGKLTAAGPFSTLVMSNRVNVACTNMTIDPGGSIDADGKGYKADNGPGKPPFDINDWAPGAGHGGRGGASINNQSVGGYTCGSLTAPAAPGSGGDSFNPPTYAAGSGGGVVRLDVADTLTVNGTISANGVSITGGGGYACGGGAGGSIFITCGTFGGTTNGLIRAQGSNGDAANGSNSRKSSG